MQKLAVLALPVLFAITLHEAAHGYVARYFGDLTAHAAGRITLNPLRHIDPIGTVVVPLVSVLVADILFGWAKPVPVNFAHLRHPRRDMMWVSLAGPASNLLMALMWAVVFKMGAGLEPGNPAAVWLVMVGAAGIFVNVIFAALNLVPLPPLDGGRVAVSLLPPALAASFSRIEPYGFIILVVLLVSGVLGWVLWPVIRWLVGIVGAIFGVAPEHIIALVSMF